MADKFNVEQQRALDNPVDVDLIISAGAGSGKTKTLSEKVMHLIEEGIKPSELLVLTFTNNAAHEMKDRIIAKFKDRKDIAYELASAHIQTFDSFSQYLVSQYSGRLKIAEQISVVDEDIIKAKKNVIVDDIFNEYYADFSKKTELLRTLKKFNLRDDANSKAVVLAIADEIEKLPRDSQDRFLNHYEEEFLSRDSFSRAIHQLVGQAKDIIKETISYSYFINKHGEVFKENDIDKIKNIFDRKENFIFDIDNIYFEDEDYMEPFYKAILSLNKLDDLEFIEKVKNFTGEYPSFFSRKQTPGAKELRNLFITSGASLKFILDLTDVEKEYEKILSFKDDIALYLEIVKEVFKRIDLYKKTTNSYLFADISNMALSLMIESQYEDIAEEVRSRFKFIMVDEYQDTNDMQELFINSLLQTNHLGTRSHLFCVGDAKQSIYGFRNSNVELFKMRQALYSGNSPEHNSISMNKNYRSGERLLRDINYIFEYYMTVNHGGIPYHQESEMLQYDENVNLYSEEYPYFGIHRIISTSSINNDDYGDAELWEARAIAHDILNKINSGFQVSIKGKPNVLKPCTFKDFTILVRVKKCVDLYQRVFNEYGIPLNCTIDSNLNEIDAIVVIQSLIELYLYRLKEETPISALYRHAFASVARSYLFEYTDQELFDLLFDPANQYFKLNNDPIIMKMDEFVKNHQNIEFSKVFLDLIDEFGIIEKLHKIGSVDDVVSKVESLYQIAVSQERAGEGMASFLNLLKDFKRYDMELSRDSLFYENDAVDLMTIHGSKGLEKKIVYMPCSFNSLTSGGGGFKPDYVFSKELGILLPYYEYDFKNAPLEDLPRFNIKNLYHQLLKSTDEEKEDNVDEHVRLFYVALTRAENMIYIVGDLPKLSEEQIEKERKSETLYGMLSYAPYYPLINQSFIERKIKEGVIKQDDYDTYRRYVHYMKDIQKRFTSEDLDRSSYDLYSQLWKEKYLSVISSSIMKSVKKIEDDLFIHYYREFIKEKDLNRLASIFALYHFNNRNVKTLDDLLNIKKEISNDDYSDLNINKETVEGILLSFKHAIVEAKELRILKINETKTMMSSMFDKKNNPDVPIGLAPYLNRTFIEYYDHEPCFKRISFAVNDYLDRVSVFNYTKDEYYSSSSPKTVYKLDLNINDEKIDFSTRTHQKASKSRLIDEELPNQEVLDRGVYLHRLLELMDFKKKNASYINNDKDRAIIQRVIDLDIFKDLEDANIYQEYGYYDDESLSTGYIDLLIQKGDEYYIIDYKAKHTADKAYISQLHTYRHNIKKIFSTDNEHIHMYLLSIVDAKLIEVK